MQRVPVARAASVHACLRTATDATHQRMHGLGPFEAIANGTLTAVQYPGLLQSLLLFHTTVGDAAVRHGWLDLSSAPARTDLLRSDLRRFGARVISSPGAWRPGSAHETLGALYAAEGSMLGGKVIGSQLDYMFGDAQDGRRFFIGSKGDGARWQRLLASLETHCAGTRELGQAIGGARFAFQLFEQCVTGDLCHLPV